MPRTINIDGVELPRLQVLRTPNGEVQVYAEYNLKAGNQLFQTVHKELTAHLGPARKAAAAALVEAIAQDISATELA